MKVSLTRDDVAAGDDPEERAVDVDARTSVSQFLTTTGRTFLPTIYGGHATWIIRRRKRGRAIAVFAQEWGCAEMVGSPDETVGSLKEVHFEYRAQTDPHATLDELRPRT